MQQGTITLLKSAITVDACPIPEGFDLETAYPTLKKHHMDTLIYEGAVRCGIRPELPVMKQLFQKYCRHLLVSEGQQRQIARIFAAFEENGIDYLPLKGCRMKALYPKPELRYMGDADILIRMEQYSKTASIMETLGYTEKVESDYELYWKCPELNAELHKGVSSVFDGDFFAYFGNGWHLASAHTGHYWTMTPEDEWIYLFVHFTKHFRDGGIGCRHMTDLWVYLRNHPNMDESYIRREMTKLQLLEFYENIRRVIAVWFEDAAADEKTVFITDYVFSCGSWGSVENHILSQSIRDSKAMEGRKGKLSYLWRTLFPRCVQLEGQYRILKKAPWMLPAVWVYRLFHKLVLERGKIQKTKSNMEKLTTEKLDARRQMLNYLGIRFG